MWISELAERSGVPVATVKFYLRERLLPPGEPVSATRSAYDESHLRRLRLIRALTDVAGLPLGVVGRVLDAVDDPDRSLRAVLGAAHSALSRSDPPAGPDACRRVDRLLRQRRWKVSPSSPTRAALARALEAYGVLGRQLPDETLEVYAETAHAVATVDLASVPTTTREEAVERAVIGTLLAEPVLLALRRLAHEDVSARAFGARRTRRR